MLGAGFLADQPPAVLPVHPFPPAAAVRAADLAGPRPPLYRLFLWVGRACWRLLIIYKLAVLRLHPKHVFGETMMLVYYVYALPLSLKIGRGFYEDGIWTEGGLHALLTTSAGSRGGKKSSRRWS